jgi:hypothetical protein
MSFPYMGSANDLEQLGLAPGAVFDPARFARDDLGLVLAPSFRVARTDGVFVMGSCCAMRDALAAAGFDAGDGNLKEKYNAFAMLQELGWCLAGGFGAAQVLRTDDGRWLNPHRAPARSTEQRYLALDGHLAAQAASGRLLRSAGVLVLTFGLIEAWYDRLTNLYTNETPAFGEVAKSRERFVLHRTTHAQNLAAMLALVRLVRTANPGVRVIASVSPVPLKATFTDPDVLVANGAGTGTLLSALHEAIALLRAEGAAIDYFPSYELVTLAPRRDDAWHARFDDGAPDGRRVRADFVERAILPLFLRTYAEDAAAAA